MNIAAAFRAGWRTQRPPPSDSAPMVPDRLHLVVALQNELARLTAVIAAQRAELDTRKSAIECERLEAENEHLKALLAARPAPPLDAGKIIAQAWRTIAFHAHPDRSPKGETGKQACERIFKALAAEFDKLKQNA